MAGRQIDINYCAECHQLDRANIFNCRWLQFNFCTITCLKQFYTKIAVACDLCSLEFNQNQRIHVQDAVPTHYDKAYRFLCNACFDRRSALATTCHYCTKRCYKGFGAQLITTTGVGEIMKYRCSIDCQAKVMHRRKQLTACRECERFSECEEINCNGQTYAICSTMCLENFKQKKRISIVKCDQCRVFYGAGVKHTHIVADRLKRKVFCSEKCVYAYVRDDVELVVCCMCRHRMPYYQSMRRSCDDRCFCSLQCIQAAEHNIEQLMQNDVQFHLDIMDLKCVSQLDNDDDDDDSDLNPGDSKQAMAAKSANTEAAVQETSIMTTVPSELLERILNAPTFRTTYNDTSGIIRCAHCQNDLESNSTIMQWEWLEFCSSKCFQSFILTFSDSGCKLCSADCDFYFGLPSAHIYGNRLYLFCTDRCEKVFFNSASFCKFCHRIADPAKILNNFCQTICQKKYDVLYTDTAPAQEESCTECTSMTNAKIRLSFLGEIYAFCSFRCYFFKTLDCEITPEQCTVCQIYFDRDPCSEVPFTLRHNDTINVFCSQSCQSHFIYKYQFVETCTICRQFKSNIKMIKKVVVDTRIHLSYCSIGCLQSIDSPYSMEKAFFSNIQP